MGARNNLTRVCRLKSTLGVMAELHQFITVFAAILSVVRQRFFGEALRETHGTHLDQRKIVIENAMAPFHLNDDLNRYHFFLQSEIHYKKQQYFQETPPSCH